MTTTPDHTYAIGQLVTVSTPNRRGLQYEGFEEGVVAEVFEKRTVAQVASPPSSRYTGIGYDTEYRIRRVALSDKIIKFSTPATPAQYIHHSALSVTPNGSVATRQYRVHDIVYILKDLSVTIRHNTYNIPKGSPAAITSGATSRSGRVASPRDPATWYYCLLFWVRTPTPTVIKTPVFINHDRLTPLPQGAQPPQDPVAGISEFVPPEADT